MQWVEVGDRVRVDIPGRGDPDHERLHRECGTVAAVHEDEASEITGDPRDAYLFTVQLDSGVTEELRWRDLRPIEE